MTSAFVYYITPKSQSQIVFVAPPIRRTSNSLIGTFPRLLLGVPGVEQRDIPLNPLGICHTSSPASSNSQSEGFMQ